MTSFGSTPGNLLHSDPQADTGSSRMLYSIIHGALSFGVVSVLAYSIWAFRLIPGTAALYSATAAVYIGLAGLALSRLVRTRGAWKRFPLQFAAGFLVYAICWCAFWFGLKGKFHADLWGSAVGLAAMTWLMQRAFRNPRGFLPLFAVLFTCHTLGYTLGGELYAAFHGATGRLLWGAAHGLGFGAGLGYLIFHCQNDAQTAVTSTAAGTSSGATPP